MLMELRLSKLILITSIFLSSILCVYENGELEHSIEIRTRGTPKGSRAKGHLQTKDFFSIKNKRLRLKAQKLRVLYLLNVKKRQKENQDLRMSQPHTITIMRVE